jgi:glycine cleavage system regulatory protein
LARQMEALVVRVLCKDVTTARCLFAESLLETNQPSFALTVVLAGTWTRVDCRRHVS